MVVPAIKKRILEDLDRLTPEERTRAAEGLVLTEWKVASSSEVGRKLKEARDQAARYAEGALAGIELTSYRYAVVVTERRESPPPDSTEGGMTYRHINIAVDPEIPSKAARRRHESTQADVAE